GWYGQLRNRRRDGTELIVSLHTSLIRDEEGQTVGLLGVSRDITAQVRSELALRESEERFRRIAETITEVFWIADVDQLKIIYISPSYERVWGRTRESLYENRRSFLDAIHPDDWNRVTETLKLQQTGQPFDHEYRVVRPDGTVRWVWDRGFPVP